MQPSTLAKRVWLLILLAVIASYFYGLGHLPLVGADEPRYAQVAHEMYRRADLITPTLGGYSWFEKPALLYWMMIAAFGLLGVSETAARLGPAICGLLTVAAVFWVGRRVVRASGDRDLCGMGPWSGLVAASMLGIVTFSRAASFDIVVTMTITWALSYFVVSELETEDARRRRLWAGFYVFVGLSLLAKGLIGIVIPFGVIGLYQVLRRAFPSRQFLKSLIWGAPLALAVAAIWYGPVIARHGWPFIDEFFVQHHFTRYLSNKYRHPKPVYFFVLCLVPLTFPWTLLLIEGLWKLRRWNWRGPDAKDKVRTLALAWLLLPLAFFSFSGSQLIGYILPVLPAAALIVGERLARFTSTGQTARGVMRATGAMLMLVSIAGGVIAIRSGRLSYPDVVIIAAPVVIAGLINLFLVEMRTMAALSVISAVLLAPFVVMNSGLVKLANPESVRDLVRQATTRGYGAAPVYSFRRIDRTPEFYAAGRISYGADGEPVVLENALQVLEVAASRGPILVLVPKEDDHLLKLKASGAEVIGDNGRFVLVAVGPR